MPKPILFGWLLLLVVSLFGCQSSLLPMTNADGQTIPFRTIAREEWGSGYDSFDPQIFLITSAEEVAMIAPYISADHLAEVQQINFAQDAVLGLFRGIQPASNHKVVIERITLLESTVTVHVQFWIPAPNQASAEVHTSPYYLVKVARSRLPASDIQLALKSRIVQP
ncbi:MAG: protease complex subunit PrcB family protein [Caldilineaceae bacterium]|nr:protease complex subunit PrcB family protein [Caldilineaceae bacterium]